MSDTEPTQEALEATTKEIARLEALRKSPVVQTWDDVDYKAFDAAHAAAIAALKKLERKPRTNAGLEVAEVNFETGIEVPLVAKRLQYLLEDMPLEASLEAKDKAEEARLKMAFSRYKARTPGWNYVSQRQPNGLRRFWRTA